MNEFEAGLKIMLGTAFNTAGYYCLGRAGWIILKQIFKRENNVKKVKEYFEKSGICKEDRIPPLIKHEENKNSELFIYHIPNGYQFKEFERKKEGLNHTLKSEVDMWYEQDRLFIRSNTIPLKTKVDFDKNFIQSKLSKCELGIPIGETMTNFVIHDLSKEYANILVAGTTGNGKSNLLNFIITSLMCSYSNKRVQFNLIDLKDGVEFDIYNNEPHVKDIVNNPLDTKIILEGLKKEKKDRMEKVKKAGKKNIKGMGMPYIITIIDEYAAMPEEYKDDITYLLQQGRAAGIMFIIATQYPRNDVVDKLISVNCGVRIAFHLSERSASEVVLKSNKAYELPAIPGRCIYKYSNIEEELQVPYIENVKKYITKKDKNENKKEKEDIEIL